MNVSDPNASKQGPRRRAWNGRMPIAISSYRRSEWESSLEYRPLTLLRTICQPARVWQYRAFFLDWSTIMSNCDFADPINTELIDPVRKDKIKRDS